MSVRRILAKTIDTDLEYEAIGIDLGKLCKMLDSSQWPLET